MAIDWDALLDDERQRRRRAPAGRLRRTSARQLARRGIDIAADPGAGRRASPSRCRPGASRPAARASRGSPARASRATSSRRSTTAPSSTAWCASRPRSRCTSRGTSPTIPPCAQAYAAERGLAFGAMNSNTFEDQPGQAHSYKFGSLSPHGRGRARAGDRAQPRTASSSARRSARARTRSGSATAATSRASCTSGGRSIGTSTACARIYAALPPAWRLFIEHKLYEPAFYSTVLNDWGVSYYCARELGDRGVLASWTSATTRRT